MDLFTTTIPFCLLFAPLDPLPLLAYPSYKLIQNNVPLFQFPALAAAWQTDHYKHSQSAKTEYLRTEYTQISLLLFARPCTGNLYKAVPRFGELCSCCCLPHLTELACSILPTMYKAFFWALYGDGK